MPVNAGLVPAAGFPDACQVLPLENHICPVFISSATPMIDPFAQLEPKADEPLGETLFPFEP